MTKKQVPIAGNEQHPSPDSEDQSVVYPLVGIGASAGGFEAFSQLLRALSADKKIRQLQVER